MRRALRIAVPAAAAVVFVAGVAFAQMGGGGMGGTMGSGTMGRGMMGRGITGGTNQPGRFDQRPDTRITEEQARVVAQQYATRYLSGFTVERVVPISGSPMYSVELRGPKNERRVLQVDGFGSVMPLGAAQPAG